MGAYLLLYPRARVVTLFIIVIFLKVISVPAFIMLGYWFLIQILSSLALGPTGGGVAFWAHIGGFVAGLVLVKAFQNRQLVDAKRRGVKIPRDEISFRGWV